MGLMIAPMLLSSLLTTVAPVALIMGGEALDKERLVRGAVQMVIVSARAAIDITYEDLVFDERTNDFSIRGLRIAVPYTEDPQDCTIEIDALTIVTLDRPDALAFSTQGDGLRIAPPCLHGQGAMAVAMLGENALNADHFSSTGAYEIGPSTYESLTLLETSAAGSVAISARMEGLHLTEGEYGDPEPRGRITHLEATLQNTDALRDLAPKLGVGDDPVGLVTAQLSAALGADGLSEHETALINSAQTELTRVLEEGGPITLRSAPGAVAEFADLVDSSGPEVLVPMLRPRFSQAVAASDHLISAERLTQALNAPSKLDPDARLAIARALVSGVGAPRSPALAADLLRPMAEDGDGSAALVFARLLLDEGDAEAAYRHALSAGASGASGARSLLDRIEADLSVGAVLDIQNDIASGEVDPPVADVAALRATARDLANGTGVPRDYQEAVFRALLASAAGDRASAMLLERLRSRLGSDNGGAETWRALEADQSRRALDLWAAGFADAFPVE